VSLAFLLARVAVLSVIEHRRTQADSGPFYPHISSMSFNMMRTTGDTRSQPRPGALDPKVHSWSAVH